MEYSIVDTSTLDGSSALGLSVIDVASTTSLRDDPAPASVGVPGANLHVWWDDNGDVLDRVGKASAARPELPGPRRGESTLGL